MIFSRLLCLALMSLSFAGHAGDYIIHAGALIDGINDEVRRERSAGIG